MIPYNLPEEKEMILHYAKLLDDKLTEKIINNDGIQNADEALHLATFFWKMVKRSNIEDQETNSNSEYILEKIIITFMAYFRASGYEELWEEVADRN